MKYTFSFLFFLIILNLAAVAQQDPQFSQNMFNHAVINPGAVGCNDMVNVSLLSRYQWVGFEGSPRTNCFNIDGAVDLFGVSSGVGLMAMSDKIGFESDVLVNFSYAYRKKVKDGCLGMGFSLGFFNYGLNPQWVYPSNGSSSGDQDPGIPTTGQKTSQVAIDAGMGLFYNCPGYYVGVSMKHINRPTIKFDNLSTYYLSRSYYLTGGYNYQIPSSEFELKPSVFIKAQGNSYQFDLNSNLLYKDRYWGGITYRPGDSFVFLLGTELLNGLRIGYSFDLVTSAISKGSYGSHEIFLGYSFNLQRQRNDQYKSVRYL